MKNLLIFVLGAIVGVVVGGKLGYEYVTTQVSNNITNIVDTVMMQGASTGGQTLIDNYQGQAKEFVDAQKEALKEEIKKEIKNYLVQKVDGFFK